MMAEGLARAGTTVYITSRKVEAGADAVEQLAKIGPARYIAADLSEERECTRVAHEVGSYEERVHILVNNAGLIWVAPFDEFPLVGWDKVVDLDLKAPFFLTRAFLPLLTAAATPDDPARVVNVGSIGGIQVPPAPAYSYAAAKAGLHHLTRMLARELGPRHITVNAIAPGTFDTKMMAPALATGRAEFEASSPLGRIGRPEDMAGIIIYLTSRAGSFVTGAVIPVDGGASTTI
jgi:NAD(P)-dependent dehydrogenase (short-subunit alcohol dehydrogenase family)